MTAAAFRTVVPRSLTLVSGEAIIINTPRDRKPPWELTKDDLISFLPHFCDQCLARINDAGKSVRHGTTVNHLSLKGKPG